MQDKRVNIFDILRSEGKLTKIKVFPATETVNDPYEQTTTKSFLNIVYVDALVQQISFEALRWKYYTTLPQDSIQIICELRHENLLKLADKIQVGDNYYKVYKDDSRGFMMMKRMDYIILVLERKDV